MKSVPVQKLCLAIHRGGHVFKDSLESSQNNFNSPGCLNARIVGKGCVGWIGVPEWGRIANIDCNPHYLQGKGG